jgi:RNA polymerase sigma-70 factor, ECF subfamily
MLEDVQATEPGPAGTYETLETQARLERAIQHLEEPQRSVVILREIEELSYKEIAEALDLSIEQVKVTLHRARKKLREELMERVAGDEI